MKNLKKLKKLTNWHITTGHVFDDLFEPAESASLKIRANLMDVLEKAIKGRGLTQQQAAKITGVSQPRMSDLLRGKIANFTIDMLVKMAVKLDISVSVRIKQSKRVTKQRCSNPHRLVAAPGVKML